MTTVDLDTSGYSRAHAAFNALLDKGWTVVIEEDLVTGVIQIDLQGNDVTEVGTWEVLPPDTLENVLEALVSQAPDVKD